MFYSKTTDGYFVFNLSNKWSSYGYIYYASLYANESNAIVYLKVMFALFGVITTLLIITMHLSAIWFARKYLYKTVYSRQDNPFSRTNLATDMQQNVQRKKCFKLLHCLPNRCNWSAKLCCSKKQANTFHKSLPTPLLNTLTYTELPKLLTTTSTSVVQKGATHPGVSIIKPLSGVDPNLEVNLISYFCLDYPVYEILFCVSEENDPVCEVVRSVQSQNPHVLSRLIIAHNKVGVNPKINNLQAGFLEAQYELLLISDSGIWMRPDTLLDMVLTMNSDERNGLIHQIPFITPYYKILGSVQDDRPEHYNQKQSYIDGVTQAKYPPFVWMVQLVFFGCWHAKLYLSAALLGINCTTGMSCLLKKSVLEPIGGFTMFGRYLAEDFFLSKYFIEQGWKIRVSHQPAWQNSPSCSLSQFLARINRWTQLRLSMVTATYFLEPFTRFLPNAICSSLSMAYFLPELIDPGVYILCYLLIWFLLDYILLIHIYPPCIPLCITKFEFFITWILSELTAVPFHLRVLLKKELQWRSKRFRVRWGGITEEIVVKSSVNDKHGSVNSISNKKPEQIAV